MKILALRSKYVFICIYLYGLQGTTFSGHFQSFQPNLSLCRAPVPVAYPPAKLGFSMPVGNAEVCLGLASFLRFGVPVVLQASHTTAKTIMWGCAWFNCLTLPFSLWMSEIRSWFLFICILKACTMSNPHKTSVNLCGKWVTNSAYWR